MNLILKWIICFLTKIRQEFKVKNRFRFVFIISFVTLNFSSVDTKAKSIQDSEKNKIFSGRVSRINMEASLVRILVDFTNMKFLNKGDQLFIFNQTHPELKCHSILEGKTNKYFLVKVKDLKFCIKDVPFNTGSYIRLEALDLMKNIEIAKELSRILLNKKMALNSLLKEEKNKIETHLESIEAVNSRYQSLKSQLETEWQEKLTLVERDRSLSTARVNQLESEIDEVEYKIEKYRVEDKNLKTDRWSLDERLYIEK